MVISGDMSGSYLGVDIDEVTPDRVSALKLKEERGVEITEVDQDAPAGKAGLREHDVVIEFNGQRVEGREQFTRFIRETPSGRTITLGIMRDGQPMQIKVTLADRKDEWAKNNKFRHNDRVRVMPPMPEIDVEIPQFEVTTVVASSTGVSVESLTPQLAQFFGVKSGTGLLVKSVEKGSAAEKAGVKAGDVIVKVDNEMIERSSDYRQAIRRRSGDTVKLTVVRNKAEQTLSLTLPNSRRDSSQLDRFQFDDEDFDFDFDFDTEPEIAVAGKHFGRLLDINLNHLGEQIDHHVTDVLRGLEDDSH
jgi:S1-C subfamily serine protease